MATKYPIKRVLFQEPILESSFGGENTTNSTLFLANKWYNVEYENSCGLIYLLSEKGEKIAIALEDMKGKMLIQR